MEVSIRILSVLFLITILFSGLITGMKDELSAEALSTNVPREPDIRLEMPPKATVDVAPGDDGIIYLTGKAFCDMPPGTPPNQICVVYLTGDAEGWPVSTPSTLTFDYRTTELPFDVAVRAPPETKAGDGYTLTISGRYRYSPGSQGGGIDAVRTLITVNPYSLLKIGTEKPTIMEPVGSWGKIELTLKNEGNTDDNITLSISCTSILELEMEEGPVIKVNWDSFIVLTLRAKQRSGLAHTEEIDITAKGSHPGNQSVCYYIVYLKTSNSPKGMVTSPLVIASGSIIILVVALIVMVSIKSIRKRSKKVLE